MDKFVIEGGERLNGTVRMSGSKNAVLPVLAATILAKGVYAIGNVPRLKDVETMARLIGILGAKAEWKEDHILRVDTERNGQSRGALRAREGDEGLGPRARGSHKRV